MQFLRNTLDKVEHHFEKGGKLESMYALYEMGDTFLFTPGSVTKKGAQGSCPTLQDLQQLQLSDAQGCSYAPPSGTADKATIGAALGLY